MKRLTLLDMSVDAGASAVRFQQIFKGPTFWRYRTQKNVWIEVSAEHNELKRQEE